MGNFSKKIASTVSMTAIVASAMGTSLVSAASEFAPYAEALANHSVINKQTTEAGYRLGDNITRAELAKVAANLGGYTSVACSGTVYSDVKQNLGDLCDAIETLAAAGVVTKANATFRPNAHVTRAEMTKMLVGAVGGTPSTVDAGYADTANLGDLTGFINKAREMGAIGAATNFRPNANGSRGEVFKIAAKVANIEVPNVEDTTNPTPGPSQTGSISVSAVGSPAAQYVPMNASSVNVGSFKVMATGGDVTLNTITIARSGLGNSTNVTVSIAGNNGRISEARTVNTSTQESVIRLNNPLTLKKGESVQLSALVSVNGQANAQHQFAVSGVNGMAITPVTLGLINTTSYETSKTIVDKVQLRSVTSGRNDQNFATVTLRAGNQDTTISGFTLTKTQGVDLTRALANVNVYRNGTKVGKAMVSSDKIVVSELATDLARNNTANYDLRADVVYVGAGDANDDIKLNISESEDVSAAEKATGFITQVQTVANPTGTVDLSSLDIVTTRKSTGTNTVAPGATNVVLLDGTIASSASFDVTKFELEAVSYPTPGTPSSVFSSLILTVDGQDHDLIKPDGSVDTVGVTGGKKTFQATADRFRVESGTPVNVQLRGTLLNNSSTGSVQYKLTVDTVKNTNTGNQTSGLGKTIIGDSLTISAPKANLRQATVSAPSGTKIYSNATDLEIARFGVEAKADEISVSKIVIESNASGSNLAHFDEAFSNARLINVADGSTVASSATISATALTFNSVNLRVAKDTTANVKLVVDTNGNLTTQANTNGKKFKAIVKVENTDVSSSSSSTASVGNSPLTVNKEYTISTNAPKVKVSPLPLLPDAPVAKVVVTNIDANTDLELKKVKLRVAFRSTANGTAPNIADVCIRNVGSSQACESGSAEVLKANPVAGTNGLYVYEITTALAGFQAKDVVSKNNGTAEFEVFIPNTPVWVAGDNASVSLTEIDYKPDGGSTLTESYVGLADASAVSTK